jgi:hypothetical protein
MKNININYVLGIFLLITACQGKPKVIQPQNNTGMTHPASSLQSNSQTAEPEVHKVVVKDFLHTSKYTYLNVTEDDSKFWVAAPRSEVEKGETYYYQGALTMYNFESKEYNRTFDTLYLVGAISKDPILSARESVNALLAQKEAPSKAVSVKIEQAEGGITIKELMANKEKYADAIVKVKGQCVKVNRHIMGRNWVHIDDGSMENADLTITTSEDVQVGSVVVFEGKIALNVDFGSGYSYAIIMEEASVVKGS